MTPTFLRTIAFSDIYYQIHGRECTQIALIFILNTERKTKFIIPTLGRLRQEDHEFQAILGYTVEFLSYKIYNSSLKKCNSRVSKQAFLMVLQ